MLSNETQLRALVYTLEGAVDHECRQPYHEGPVTETYVRHAEAMGLKTQTVCDSGGSTGAYYTVTAVYEGDERIHGRKPLCLIFEDFSRSVPSTWLMA